MRPICMVQAALALSVCMPTWAAAQGQTARLSGQLLADDRTPVVGAEVTLTGASLVARSDSSGRFVLDGITPGAVRVQTRAVGYAPLDTTVTLRGGDTHILTLRMARAVQQLAPVITEAALPYGKPLRYQHTGKFDDFYERRAKRPGTFFTREDIERGGRNTVVELMSSVPGVIVGTRPGGVPYIRVARCVGNSIRTDGNGAYGWLAVFINGSRVEANLESLNEMKAYEIETLEVYRGSSQLPTEAVGNACAAVFITTRYTTGSVLSKK